MFKNFWAKFWLTWASLFVGFSGKKITMDELIKFKNKGANLFNAVMCIIMIALLIAIVSSLTTGIYHHYQ